MIEIAHYYKSQRKSVESGQTAENIQAAWARQHGGGPEGRQAADLIFRMVTAYKELQQLKERVTLSPEDFKKITKQIQSTLHEEWKIDAIQTLIDELGEKLEKNQVSPQERPKLEQEYRDWKSGIKRPPKWRPIIKAPTDYLDCPELRSADLKYREVIMKKYLRGEESHKIKRDTGSWQINLIAMKFDELSPSYQRENIAAGECSSREVKEAVETGTPMNRIWLENTSAKIHREWQGRNQHIYRDDTTLNQTQRLDYFNAEFPEAQRNKDRAQVIIALEAYVNYMKEKLAEKTNQAQEKKSNSIEDATLPIPPERVAELRKSVAAQRDRVLASVPSTNK